MIVLLVLISVALTLACVKARGVFWPGSIVAITSCVHLLYFWITGVLRFVPGPVAHWWHYKQPIDANATYVVAIYFVQCLIGACSLLIPRNDKKSEVVQVETNPKLTNVLNAALIAAALGFITVAFLHAVVVDWGYLFNYSEYLSARDPDAVGIRFPPMRVFHRVAAQGAFVLLACLFLLKKRHRSTVFLVSLCALYGFVLSVSNLSRFSTVFPLIFGLQALDSNNVIVRRAMIVGGLLVSLVCYANIISMRLNSDLRDERLIGEFGLAPFCSNIAGLSFINKETISASMMSVSASGFQLSHAIDHIHAYQIPTIQKLRCFSPLPSAIDKYAENYENSYYAQPQKSGPYSAVGESLVFGFLWVAAILLILLAMTMFASDIVATVNSAKSATIVTLLFASAILFFQTYPIRSGNRLIWMIFAIWLVVRVPYFLHRRRS